MAVKKKTAVKKKAASKKKQKRKSPVYSKTRKANIIKNVLANMVADDARSLRTACKKAGVPCSTFLMWCSDDDRLAEQYDRARNVMMDIMAEDILDIADDGSNDYMTVTRKDGSKEEVLDREHVQRSRLRVDSRKWILSKIAHKKYGDKVQLAGDKENPVVVETVTRKIVKPD